MVMDFLKKLNVRVLEWVGSAFMWPTLTNLLDFPFLGMVYLLLAQAEIIPIFSGNGLMLLGIFYVVTNLQNFGVFVGSTIYGIGTEIFFARCSGKRIKIENTTLSQEEAAAVMLIQKVCCYLSTFLVIFAPKALFFTSASGILTYPLESGTIVDALIKLTFGWFVGHAVSIPLAMVVVPILDLPRPATPFTGD